DFQPVAIRSPDEIEQAFAKIAVGHFDGIVINNDPMLFNERKRLAQMALMRGLPLMAFLAEMVDAGALMSYGRNNLSLFRSSAT
ncbi:hypothetical protein Q8G41_28530, partial [Klebsiella pneumoniae]|uniref:hypothetical protein n=1 Tax=Klebsiella pneumoniae TaxID=573 RepID=UPI0030134B88